MDILILICRLALAAVFAVSGISKLMDLSGSRKAMQDFGIPGSIAKFTGPALPVVELVIAVALIPAASAWWGAVGALLLLIAFSAAIGINLARGNTPACHCFGQLSSEPVGTSTLIRNGVLATVSLVPLFGGMSQPGFLSTFRDGNLSVSDETIVLVLIGQALAIVLGWWLTIHLLTQNGRLLLRLEALEIQPVRLQAPPAAPASKTLGLPVGSPAPDFTLDDLQGQPVALATLRAERMPILAVFSDPGCGPCARLMPDIALWQREFAGTLNVVLIASGSPENNRNKAGDLGIERVLLDPNRQVAKAYDATGTPAAVLIMPDGTVGSNLAAGVENIRKLVPASPPARLPAVGSPVPNITLPDLDGVRRSLADVTSRTSVLLFWNPACGFCQRMAHELRAWLDSRPADAPELILISTGSPEANRAMNLDVPTLLDQDFATGRAFGARGTPAAVQIEAGGTIASRVVVGGPAIVDLLDTGALRTASVAS